MSAAEKGTDDIVLHGVRKRFQRKARETLALDGVDLTIEAGEFISVVGPSGCGKSTLLRLIAGLVAPSQGSISVGGKPVRGPVTDVGIVFQGPVLVEWRTILGNVLLQAELRKLRPLAHYRARAEELMAAVGLRGFEASYPHELSGGMQQRASIVRALIHDPPRLLMDEPFGALDALTREQLRIDLEELWMASRTTVLFITHSVEEAVLLSDRVVVMTERPGRIDRILKVDLPRPRGLEARRSPQFGELCDEITGVFLSRGVLAARRSLKGPGLVGLP